MFPAYRRVRSILGSMESWFLIVFAFPLSGFFLLGFYLGLSVCCAATLYYAWTTVTFFLARRGSLKLNTATMFYLLVFSVGQGILWLIVQWFASRKIALYPSIGYLWWLGDQIISISAAIFVFKLMWNTYKRMWLALLKWSERHPVLFGILTFMRQIGIFWGEANERR